MESEKERILWELEEQRAVQAAREQVIAKQERKIESLSTLVIKSASDGSEHRNKSERKAKRVSLMMAGGHKTGIKVESKRSGAPLCFPHVLRGGVTPLVFREDSGKCI